LFTMALSKWLAGTRRTANCLNPGIIRTKLGRHRPDRDTMFDGAGPEQLKSIEQGAATQALVASHPSLDGISGGYFADCQVQEARPPSMDAELAEQLWASSAAIAARL
jgi:NAD(P)-dependent dehydrogenase (short-subunit alcohol dehydrogenase family)